MAAPVDDFDVFLNHRGPDVKAGFVSDLHDALKSASLNPFLDKKCLAKGNPDFASIDAALEMARVHVAVVSRGYAESKYCLSELVAMLSSNKPVIPVFYDIEPADLRRVEKGPFAAAFTKHKCRETADRVQEWADALCKLADITGFCSSDYKENETQLKQEVVDAILDLIHTNEALQVETHLVGLEEHVNTCIHKLEQMSGSIGLLRLVGMGGIGKTTLAKEIYNRLIGYEKFQAMSFLEIDHILPSSMDVEGSLLRRLQKQLLLDLLHVPEDDQKSYTHWFKKISSHGLVLIVLDDIQNKSQFDKLIPDTSFLPQGSYIIVTSRDRHLLNLIGGRMSNDIDIHEVTPLAFDDSFKLFNLHAFGDEEAPKNFEALASDVSKVCGGLPLALKVVGSSLFDKRSDEDRECIWPEAIEALKEDANIINALKWSYTCLLELEKLMFVDIACVFYSWKKHDALEIWKSCKKCSSCCGCGTPHFSLRRLIDKSLIVLSKDSDGDQILTMHSLLLELGKDIGKVDGSHLCEVEATKTREENNQGLKNVRALNLINIQKYKFEVEKFGEMPNLHYLILDGCDVSGNLGSISKELRWLQWRYMPLAHLPSMLNMSNLISLDFSQSTKLPNTWTEANPTLEGCPNLLKLNLNDCTSITTLPHSIGRLSKLQVLFLQTCTNLRQLPSSIGQLTALQELYLFRCESLEGLPDTITALSGLWCLHMDHCSSVINLPTSFGFMTGLTSIYIDLITEQQALHVAKLNGLKELGVTKCTDEAITMLDTSSAFTNLAQLFKFNLYKCKSMTKLPQTIRMLKNLDFLNLWGCEKLHELPNSIGELKLLTKLSIIRCSNLETLPDSLDGLTKLQDLVILQCTAFTRLPTVIGLLSSLHTLKIEDNGELESLPESLKELNKLRELTVMECGSLEGLGAWRALQGLRIWGCTSTTNLPGCCLMVLDGNFCDPSLFLDLEECRQILRRNLKDLGVVERNECGFLRLVQDSESGRSILQRVHKLPCSQLAIV